MRGRKPQSPAEKALKGIKGPPTLPIAGDCPSCPMPLDEIGQAEWERFAPILHAAGRLSDVDAPALWLYCDAFSRHQVAAEDLRLNGPVIHSDLGGIKANPAAAVVKEASAAMVKILSCFGATPADRGKVGGTGPAPASPLKAFLGRARARQ